MEFDWLKGMKVVTDILDSFWESRKEEKKEKTAVRPNEIVDLHRAKLLKPREARALLRSIGIVIDDNDEGI